MKIGRLKNIEDLVYEFLFDNNRLINSLVRGELSERFKEAVLKTVEAQASGGSNPSLSDGLILIIGEVGEGLKPAVC